MESVDKMKNMKDKFIRELPVVVSESFLAWVKKQPLVFPEETPKRAKRRFPVAEDNEYEGGDEDAEFVTPKMRKSDKRQQTQQRAVAESDDGTTPKTTGEGMAARKRGPYKKRNNADGSSVSNDKQVIYSGIILLYI